MRQTHKTHSSEHTQTFHSHIISVHLSQHYVRLIALTEYIDCR